MDVPHEKQFHFHDGTAAGSLQDLAKRIESISYQEFYRHVNPDKNDFANWVRHVLREETLADELDRVTSIVETVEIINDFLHPRSPTQSQDLQSQIERSIFGDRPLAADAPLPVEEVPTTAVVPQTDTTEVADFRIIHENARPVQESAEPKMPEHPAGDDHARMVLRDFMYGLVFGLIVGIVLGRILAT